MSLATTIRNNRATFICGLLLAALLAALWLGLRARAVQGRMAALVHDGDGGVHTLPLNEDASLTVSTSLGSNTVAVEDGAVRVVEADCPNGTCMQHAPISTPEAQIICLPHKLWIEVVPEGSEGGTMDVALAEDTDDGVDLVAR